MSLTTQPRRVLIVLPQQVHLMDMAGAAQVFTTAAELTSGWYEVSYVAEADTTTSHQGLALHSPTGWPTLERRDLVVVAGWKRPGRAGGLSERLLGHLREHWQRGGHVASICAGALALAEAGILNGHRATTHHDLLVQLGHYRDVDVVEDVLFTCAPRLHTSAGIASGIDLCLHLVAHDHGPALAARIARTLVVPAWRPGDTSQQSVTLAHRNHMDHLAHRAQDMLDDPSAPHRTLAEIAQHLGVSGRTLARHFTRATGMTPHEYAVAVRRERAERLRLQGWSQEASAQAVGYADARSLRRRGA